ncbi:glycosyltransferase [Candidatus Ruminimicrobiellum ovillum]|uniref:glycosyltransferase n=1 Tax=Candidatus Ruminimicrobiellum ovillum TaxID=1947927 RepID=UPI003559C347
MTNKPLISIMMPTYNNGKYIKQAIESIYAQNYDNIEIIVVDDGSTDNTKEILKQYKDIKYFYIEHKGIPFARNVALENSKGEYIAFCDSDDYWLPNKINKQMQYFKDHPNCEIVFTKYENFFENENLKTNRRAVYEKKVEDVFKQYLPSSIVKKSLFDKYGFFDENFNVSEDTEFLYRIFKKGIKVNNIIPEVLYKRRIHGKNVSLKYNTDAVKKYIATILRKGVLSK